MFDVITIGTATRDVFIKSLLFKVVHGLHLAEQSGIGSSTSAECFALGSKIEIDRPVLSIGGGAANSAVTFARQGFSTASFYKVGRDEFARDIFETLRAESVTPFPIEDKEGGTAYSTILIAPTGERTVLVYRGSSDVFKKDSIPFSRLDANAFYISPGRIPLPVMSGIVNHVKRTGALVAMNPSKYYLGFGIARLSPLFRQLDLVIVNREEASYLTGLPYPNEKAIFRMFDEHVPGIAVMTEGKNGVIVSDGALLYRAGVFKEKEVADRTGAEDAFGSGFLAGLLRHRQGLKFREGAIEYAIRLGSANATSVVERIGAQAGILKRDEFEKSVRWNHLRVQYKKL